ncbi:MAG: rod shape-determining protein MreD [Candidatus Omnitrophica bacterium]|nr:rod shape-determining protein MreD [Candidatus Omnitrophota bacterium]
MMKSRNLFIFLLIFCFTILQSTVLNYLQIFATQPDLLLILIIFCSLTFGKIYGLTTGAISGIFAEVSSGFSSGILVFTYALGGLILGYIGRWVELQKTLGQVIVSFIFTFLIYLFIFLLLKIGTGALELSLFNALRFTLLPAAAYTAILTPIMFKFLKIILGTK